MEEVIQKVGEDFKLKLVFSDWSNRGVKGYEHAPMCLRMSPEDNLTNGFFVACFERRKFQGNGSHAEKEGVGCSESRLTLNNGDESTRTFTRKEKKRLKKRAKKAQKNLLLSSVVTEFERDDKEEDEDVNCASKDDRNIKIIPKSEDLDSSYLATETEEVLRVDNSLPYATPIKNVFCGGQKYMGKASVESERVRMFRKRSIEFLDVSNHSCCVLQCTPSGEAAKRAKRLSDVVGFGSMVRNAEITEKTFGAHGDASRHELVTGVRSHSSAEKRKLKKLRRKEQQSKGFSFSG